MASVLLLAIYRNKTIAFYAATTIHDGGEIDIIAMSPDQLVVFVEVKHYKAGSMVSPLEAITRSKQRTICKVANQFLSRSPYRSLFSRIDIIVVCNHHVSQHIENAF